MEQFIIFSTLSKQLSTTELQSFFVKMMTNDNCKSFILESMSHEMIKRIIDQSSSKKLNLEMVKDINNALKEIMYEGDASDIPNDIESNQTVPISINNLSSIIINEIGQYLYLNDLCHFEVTNRKFCCIKISISCIKNWFWCR